jgi:flagellar assembly factor FliW
VSLTIESSRFGQVEIDPQTVIEFPEGLIGLGGSRFALLARDGETPFLWLQSLKDRRLAIPVTNPYRFFADYKIVLSPDDEARLGLAGDRDVEAKVYVTVCAAASLEAFTANLKAPILVWDDQAYQVINQSPGSELKARLFAC